MITRRTKLQLMVFVIITLVGVSYVGARYAQLDRLFYDSSYTVVAHLERSGGIFAGGEVTYRGVGVGRVDKLELTDEGVDAYLSIENDYDSIPAETLAVVGNRSAVGEQYVELQPKVETEPYLEQGSEIALEDTRTPIATEVLLENLSTTVGSVDRGALRTTVSELGEAFAGTGEDLQRIIDTGNSFIETANDNFDVTTALIRDANVVLNGQIASESAIRTFADQLALFSGTLAEADPDLRRLIANGSPLRRRGRLHRRLEVPRHRALRRALRADHHRHPDLPQRLPEHRHASPAERREPPDERGRALRGAAGAEQRARRPERLPPPRGVLRPVVGGGLLRPGLRRADLGRAPPGGVVGTG